MFRAALIPLALVGGAARAQLVYDRPLTRADLTAALSAERAAQARARQAAIDQAVAIERAANASALATERSARADLEAQVASARASAQNAATTAAQAANAAATAQTTASTAKTAAEAAQAGLVGVVRSINGAAPTSGGAVSLALPATPDLTPYALRSQLPDLSGYATRAQLPDLAPYALKTQLPDVSGFATTAALTGVQATVMAAMPKAATSPPPTEMVGGSIGTAGTYRPADAAVPRISRAGTTITDANGNWAITWSSALAQVPVALPIPVDAGAQPVMCTVATRTMTGATGRCFRSQLLPSTLTLVSALVNFNVLGGSASGVTVQVLAIPPTQ